MAWFKRTKKGIKPLPRIKKMYQKDCGTNLQLEK